MQTRASMRGLYAGALLVAGSIILTSCGTRTDEEGGSSQPIFNANGDLISGGDGSIPLLGEAEPVEQLTLRVISDVNSIATGGTDVATITALVTDDNNNAVAASDVTFRSTGGVLQNISPSTDDNGEAIATLRLPQDFQNQDIIVAVSAGEFEASVKVIASGSTLEVTGPDNLVSGDSAELVVRLMAGNGEPIANQLVTVLSAAGNSISPAEIVTDTDGRAEISVGSENSNDTVSISSLNTTVSVTHSFNVVEDFLSFINLQDGSELVVGTENLVQVNWTSQGLPVVGQPLTFNITAGRVEAPSAVVTDALGNASVRVSSASAGPAKITVEAGNGSAPETDIDVEFIATGPETLSIDASSSLVNINETSTITALVTDRLGNPVKNTDVSFTGLDLKGGQLSPASAITNSAGVASVTFTGGESATEQDEINIVATVKGSSINDRMVLTVFKRALNVTLGSSNQITIKPLSTQYAMPLIVQVSDGSGTPLENATVRVSVRPLGYAKGALVLVDENGQTRAAALAANEDFNADQWAQLSSSIVVCQAEDFDGDRLLDTLGPVSEDINNNGSLDPQDPASLAAVEGGFATLSGGSLRTDINGSGFFELLYPASNANWAYVEITARAEALGEETTDSYQAWLAMPATEATAVDRVPANFASPYGLDTRNDVEGQVVVGDPNTTIFTGCTTTF